ncbi:MAG: alkaline phosphatase PhoX [Prochloraceae cyanobacterium]
MSFSRRNFLTLAGASAATVVLASPLKNLYANVKAGKTISSEGFGNLTRDPQGILDLPAGFQYRAFSRTGDKMSDGNLVPQDHDGMAAFRGPNNTTIVVRNHEISPNQPNPVNAPDNKKYDRLCRGGTTTLIIDNKDRSLIKDYVSLAGTIRNCAGGSTPWGSWISCEEDVSTPDSQKVALKHGYNFEVPAVGGLVDPVPLKAMGRFNHEAIAVDPVTGYVYQTEDRDDSCIYRFRPKQPGDLQAGGFLDALVIKNMPKTNTSINLALGDTMPVEWIQLEDVDPQRDTLRYEAQSKGAAIFKRGEGICYGNGEIYWTCTSGGKAGRGQVFRFDPIAQTLQLFVESPGINVLDYPDNLTMSPFGDLMMCEDGWGEQFLVGVNAEGQCYKFARNALNNSEFAGVCFSPDGKTMFVNIQRPGITLAVWGNWTARAI